MRRHGVVSALLAMAVAIPVATTEAAPGDPRVVQGLIEWTAGPSAPFVVVRGDDGRYYYIDVARLTGPRAALNRGDRVAVTGVEGYSPHEIAGVTVQAGPAPAVALTPPGALTPGVPLPPPPASAPVAPAPPAAEPPATVRTEPPPMRLDGRVEAISGSVLVLRIGGGRNVTVHMAAVGANIGTVVRPGDELTVFGRPDDSRGFVATGYVHTDAPASGMALPRPRR
jgi:hypothetical protein